LPSPNVDAARQKKDAGLAVAVRATGQPRVVFPERPERRQASLRRSVVKPYREALAGAVDPVTAGPASFMLQPRREGGVAIPANRTLAIGLRVGKRLVPVYWWLRRDAARREERFKV
jgi:hypothetical protein